VAGQLGPVGGGGAGQNNPHDLRAAARVEGQCSERRTGRSRDGGGARAPRWRTQQSRRCKRPCTRASRRFAWPWFEHTRPGTCHATRRSPRCAPGGPARAKTRRRRNLSTSGAPLELRRRRTPRLRASLPAPYFGGAPSADKQQGSGEARQAGQAAAGASYFGRDAHAGRSRRHPEPLIHALR
jgi:hypothetical protein